MIKTGIHDLVLPGPGQYVRPIEEPKNFLKNMMATRDGALTKEQQALSMRTSFNGTAVGISVNPDDRCDTPRGRGQWVNGSILPATGSGAPEVCTQQMSQTKDVISDMYANLNATSSFLHDSFNLTAQRGARYPLLQSKVVAAGNGLDSRGHAKMNRYCPQPSHLTRNANAML